VLPLDSRQRSVKAVPIKVRNSDSAMFFTPAGSFSAALTRHPFPSVNLLRITASCGWRFRERRPRSFAIRAFGLIAEHQSSTFGAGQAEEARLPDCGSIFGCVLDGRRSGSAASVAMPAAVPEPGFITSPVTRFPPAGETSLVARAIEPPEFLRHGDWAITIAILWKRRAIRLFDRMHSSCSVIAALLRYR